jgi:nicotinamide mononucleotide transporter
VTSALPPREVAALWLGAFALLAAAGAGVLPFSWTETLGFVSGGVCVWLAVRRHALTWPVGLANNALYFAVFLEARLYADTSLQAVYFALGCYGWWVWTTRRGGSVAPVSRVPRSEALIATLAIPIATFALHPVLVAAHGAAPFWDALTTAISLVAQVLLGRKRIENWLLWILVDVIYVPLYVSRGLMLTAALYGVYLGMCVVGLRDWLRAGADPGEARP